LARGRKPRVGDRQTEAEDARLNILEVAAKEFADKGLAGARVDEIAEKINSSKRMIYYYFGGKEQLYLAVLENAYRGIREAEQRLDVRHLDPIEAIRSLAELTYDHHVSHPEFIRLVSIENIHQGAFIKRLDSLRTTGAAPAVTVLDEVLSRGRAAGEFRDDVDALDVHLVISAYCVFQVANVHTFGFLFGRDMAAPENRDHLRRMIGDVVAGWLTAR